MRAHGYGVAPPPGYSVEGRLGAGGFGVVLAARRERDGAAVAIKLAHEHVPLAHLRLEREAAALELAGVQAAPRVLDVGHAGGRPFVVLERLTSPSLAARLEAGPVGPAEAARIGDALLAALELVHARGLVHRDLKPGHVFFDGRAARLIDFGLASAIAAAASPALTAPGDVIGTAEYLAPEACAGAASDARADLYAVGVILYQLVTGRVPFSGARAEVLAAQLERRPPRAARSAPIGPALDEVIARCLAKDPARRFESAAALRGALAAAARVDGAAALPAAHTDGARDVSAAHTDGARDVSAAIAGAAFPTTRGAAPSVARAVALLELHGFGDLARLAELAELAGASLAHLSGARVIFTLDGDHPVRAALDLGREVLRLALARRAHVNLDSCFDARRARPVTPDDGDRPTEPRLSPAAAAALAGDCPVALVGRAPLLDELTAAAAAALVRRAPAVVTVVGEGGQGKSALARALAERLASVGDVLVLAPDARSLDALRARARSTPLCVLVDDAHRAPGLLLDELERAALAESRAPLWICALARPWFVDRRRDFGRGAATCTRVTLESLAPADAEELCRRLLAPAEHVPRAALERIAGRARGNPLLLTLLTAALRRGGHVRAAPRGHGFYLATDEINRWPPSAELSWLVDAELAGLAPELAAHAALAAQFEGGVTAVELGAVLDELDRGEDGAHFPLDARAALERLLRSGLLDRDGARLRFRHQLVRDEIARRLDARLAARVHHAAFALLCRAPGDDDERLADHAARAGLHAEAAERYRRLAEHALARHGHVDAEIAFSRALEQLTLAAAGATAAIGPSPAAAHAHRGRGEARSRSGRYRESLDDFAAARALARSSGDRRLEAELLLDEATALDWMNELDRSRTLVEEAAALAPPPRDAALEARLLVGRGRAAWREHRWAEARVALEAAAALAGSVGDYQSRVAALLMLGHLLPALGAAAEAARVFDEVIALCRARDDRRHLAAALNNRLNLWLERGDAHAAARDQREFMRLARELGLWASEQHGRYNLALIDYQRGAFADARAGLDEARAVETRHPTDEAFASALDALAARLELAAGDAPAARRLVAAVRARVRAPGPWLDVQLELVELAVRGAPPSAWTALEARALEHSLHDESIEAAELRGLDAARRGRVAESRAHLAEAESRVRRRPNFTTARLARALARLPARVSDGAARPAHSDRA